MRARKVHYRTFPVDRGARGHVHMLLLLLLLTDAPDLPISTATARAV
ncbi:MAG TPA: hypothetical protein VKD72_24540 [Gemmataceae bacterium]|nr:hypothetical protein [Gemmataceae bacterium]